MSGINKLRNEYLDCYGDLFDATPKAVFAAMAFSFAFIDVEERSTEAALTRLRAEWEALYSNGIVPQKLAGAWKRIKPEAE